MTLIKGREGRESSRIYAETKRSGDDPRQREEDFNGWLKEPKEREVTERGRLSTGLLKLIPNVIFVSEEGRESIQSKAERRRGIKAIP